MLGSEVVWKISPDVCTLLEMVKVESFSPTYDDG